MDFSSFLESGVSDELRGLLAQLEHTSGHHADTADSKFGKKASDWLRTAVFTHNYDRDVWWLTNLLAVIEARGPQRSGSSAVLEFFYDQEAFASDRFRAFFEEAPQSAGLACRWTNSKLHFRYADASQDYAFVTGLLRQLAALHEFLLGALEPPEWELPGTADLRADPSLATVERVHGELVEKLNTYLKAHMRTEQEFEKGREVHNYLHEEARVGGKPQALDDESVMAFWLRAQETPVKDFKLYTSVSKAFFKLAESYADGREALDVHAPLYIAPQSTDPELSVDQWGLSQNFQAILDGYDDEVDELISVLNEFEPIGPRLNAKTNGGISFLMGPDLKRLEAVDQPRGLALVLPLTVLRDATFGYQQVRISQAKRQGRHHEVPQLAACGDVPSFAAVLKGYDELHGKLGKARDATVHALFGARYHEAPKFVLRLADEDTLEGLALESGDAWQADPFVAIRRAALKHPPLNALLRRCRTAYDGIDRKGFKTLPESEALHRYVAGLQALEQAIDLVSEFCKVVTIAAQKSGGFDACFDSDLAIFKATFEQLEGAQT